MAGPRPNDFARCGVWSRRLWQRVTAPVGIHARADFHSQCASSPGGPMTYQRSNKGSARLRGFTLIELLVGLTLGVLVLFALVTLFVNSSRMRREIDQASQQIENGRYALD